MFWPHSYQDIPRDDLLEAATILLFFIGSKEWIWAENEDISLPVKLQWTPPYSYFVNTNNSNNNN